VTAPTKVSYRRIATEFADRRWSIVLLALGTVLEVAVTGLLPLVIAHGVTAAVRRDADALTFDCLLLGGLTLAGNAVTYAVMRGSTRLSQDYLASLRRRLLDRLFLLDLGFFDRERTGRVVARLTSDVEALQQFLEGGVVLATRAVLTLVVTIVLLSSQSLVLAGIVVVCASPVVLTGSWYRRNSFAAQRQVREANADLLTHMSESLNAVAVVQSYGLADDRSKAFAVLTDRSVAAKMRASRLAVIYQLSLDLMPTVCLGAVAVVGALLVEHDQLHVQAVIAALLYVTRVFDPVQQFAELSNLTQAAGAAFSKVFAFHDQQAVVRDHPSAVPLAAGPGLLEIDAVEFAYGPMLPTVLHGLDLTIEPGERLCLVGSSGSGKSTVAKLLARFYEPQEGAIRIDGQDLRDVTAASLRARLALVPQEGYLFDGTVAHNIGLGKPGTDEDEVRRACRRLGVLHLLDDELPDGLQTAVSGGGTTLSPGQRQLVALARAYVADPDVLVLDEATSHLDPATHQLVERALRTLLAGRTSIVIAHRVATAMSADRVAVLDGGRLVALGPPDVLQSGSPAFRRWLDATQVEQDLAG
jgi:ABC-type multidrug transport system fused ATPase/permease subunit